MRKFLAAVAACVLVLCLSVPSSAETNRHKYLVLHAKCEKQHGKRPCGRNAVHDGLRRKDRTVRAVRQSDYKRLLPALRSLTATRPYLMTKARSPMLPPAGTASPSYAPAGVAACIVWRESRGDPQANNGSHFGIAQWDLQTWRAHGGTRFASTPLGASKQEQLQVLSYALSHGQIGAWRPYDHC